MTTDLVSVEVMHHGQKVTIMRNQNQDNLVNPDFAKTSRKCPPFCIQPSELAPGVKTIAELEVLYFLMQMNAGDESLMVIDSRTPNWVEKGTYTRHGEYPMEQRNKLDIGKSGPVSVQEILEKQLHAKSEHGFWNFEEAKTMVMFCNGPWCGQSPVNIRDLLKIGYPAHKIFWYRGGMQDWESLELTTGLRIKE